MGTADFPRVLAAVEAEYGARTARRIAGDAVMWELRDGSQYLQGGGDVPMGMPAGISQVSRVNQAAPGLGCPVCREASQVLVPCDHNAPEQDCPRCGGTGKTCAACHGAGRVTVTEVTARGGQVPSRIPCGHPDGTDGADCTRCHASGKVCAACAGSDQRAVPCPGCQPCAECGKRACPDHPGTGAARPPEPEPAAVPEFIRARSRVPQDTPTASIWR